MSTCFASVTLAVYGPCQGGEPLTKVCFAGRPSSPPDCPISCASFVAALKNGHPDCLSYWHMVRQMPQPKAWNSHWTPHIYRKAAEMQSAEELMYVHDVLGLPWDADTCKVAARRGSIDCLSYAHASGCPWDESSCELAALEGNLPCLAYAHEHGSEWSTHTLHYAARRGHLECLKYAHTHGCPYNASGPVTLTRDDFRPLYLTTQAVLSYRMPCLAYVREVMGCAWDPKGTECKLAFEWGNVELLRYIHSHGGVLCTPFELLCLNIDFWLYDVGDGAERKAMCLLYVLCYGSCQVKYMSKVRHTTVGMLALELIKAMELAVLLSFHGAGKARVGIPQVAAAHAAMQRMPKDLLQEILCAAGLQFWE